MSTNEATVQTATLTVPGATLYYEVRGLGPVLLCISGGPTDAGMFTELAGRLADRYTVVTYDQRGHSRSTLDREPEDLPIAVHADDAAAILRAVGTSDSAYVYGNSGGGTIGLELVVRHPGLVRTLVAHETFLMELLPDAERWRSEFDEIAELYRAEGVMAAMGKFGAIVEEGGPRYSEEMQQRPPSPESQEMMARMAGNFDLFIAHELQLNGRYVPDLDALRSASTRIVSAAGATSGEQAARRSALALAERLGIPSTQLPGAHGGWGSDPEEFAERLHEVLQEGRTACPPAHIANLRAPPRCALTRMRVRVTRATNGRARLIEVHLSDLGALPRAPEEGRPPAARPTRSQACPPPRADTIS